MHNSGRKREPEGRRRVPRGTSGGSDASLARAVLREQQLSEVIDCYW